MSGRSIVLSVNFLPYQGLGSPYYLNDHWYMSIIGCSSYLMLCVTFSVCFIVKQCFDVAHNTECYSNFLTIIIVYSLLSFVAGNQ